MVEVIPAKPKLIIPADKWKKLKAFVDIVDTEITGFADVDWNEEKEAFVVGEVYLVDQVAGGADVEMHEDDIADFNLKLMQQGVEQLPRLWWHSHVDMQAFFSGTDEQTITQDFTSDTFTISLVVNKRSEYKISLMIYDALPEDSLAVKLGVIKNPIRVDGLTLHVESDEPTYPEEWIEEVKEKVKTRVYPPPAQTGQLLFDIPKKKIHTNTLPKDQSEALEKIQKNKLRRTWKRGGLGIVFVDPESGAIWEDKWKAVTLSDYVAINSGINDTDMEEYASIYNPEGLVCKTCSYAEESHNDTLCTTPIFVKRKYLYNNDEGEYWSTVYGDDQLEDDL